MSNILAPLVIGWRLNLKGRRLLTVVVNMFEWMINYRHVQLYLCGTVVNG